MNTNELIARFMGAEYEYQAGYDLFSIPALNDIFTDEDGDDPNSKHYYFAHEMLFDKSWDWLMPVARKVIETCREGGDPNGLIGDITKAIISFDHAALYDLIETFLNTWTADQNTKINNIYMKNGARRCPFCDGDMGMGSLRGIEEGFERLSGTMECPSCHRSWLQLYVIERIENL